MRARYPRPATRAWRNGPRFLFATAAASAVAYGAALTCAGLETAARSASGRFAVVDAFTGFTPVRQVANVSYLLLMAVYLAWLVSPKPRLRGFLEVLKPAALFLLVAFATYPLSSDVYQYLQYGAMLLQGVNPYVPRTQDLPSAVAPLLAWPASKSAYGPVAVLLFAAPAHLLPAGVAPAVYAYKALCLVLHVANGYLVWRLLSAEPRSGDLAENAALAYLVNPHLLSQQVADAHVDVLLNLAVLLLAGCLRERRYFGAILSLVLALLVKVLALVWAPILILFLVRKRAWSALGAGAVSAALIALALAHTLFPTPDAWASLLPGVPGTARSVHHIARLFLDLGTKANSAHNEAVLSLLGGAARVVFLASYAWMLGRAFRGTTSGDRVLVHTGWATLILLLFATPWLMPWYPGVLLALMPFTLQHPRFTLAGFTLSLSIGLVVGGGAGHHAGTIVAALTTIVPPVLVLALGRRLDSLDLAGLLARKRTPAPARERPTGTGPSAA